MRRLVATLAAVLVIAPLTAAPATAGEPSWPTIPCTSGAIDVIELTPAGDLTLAGQLDCADPTPVGAAFGLASYRDGWPYAPLPETYLLPYAPVAPSPFSVSRPLPLSPSRLGICLVTGGDARVACVEVGRDPLTRVPAVRPLATDDPLVAAKVRIAFSHDGGGNPVCGTCW